MQEHSTKSASGNHLGKASNRRVDADVITFEHIAYIFVDSRSYVENADPKETNNSSFQFRGSWLSNGKNPFSDLSCL